MLRKTSSLEALRLYRDVLRAARNFNFPNEKGQLWSTVLARSARGEFEAARHVTDPEMIARLLVMGTDALMKIQQQFEVAEQRLVHAVTTGPATGVSAPQQPVVMDDSPYALPHRAVPALGEEGGDRQGQPQWRAAGSTSAGAGPVLVREDGLPVHSSPGPAGLTGKAREAVSTPPSGPLGKAQPPLIHKVNR